MKYKTLNKARIIRGKRMPMCHQTNIDQHLTTSTEMKPKLKKI